MGAALSLVGCQSTPTMQAGPFGLPVAVQTRACQSLHGNDGDDVALEYPFKNRSSQPVTITGARLVGAHGVEVVGGPFLAWVKEPIDVYPVASMPSDVAAAWAKRTPLRATSVHPKQYAFIGFEFRLRPGVESGTAGRVQVDYTWQGQHGQAMGVEQASVTNRAHCPKNG